MPDIFLSRQPRANRQSKIIATRLTLHPARGATTRDAVNALSALADFGPRGEKRVFIDSGRMPDAGGLLDWQVPGNATLELRPAALADADFVAALQSAQASLCLIHDA